jgi:hypothetical protein
MKLLTVMFIGHELTVMFICHELTVMFICHEFKYSEIYRPRI